MMSCKFVHIIPVDILEYEACVVSQKMAGAEGFEPTHAGIKIRCLNQLGDAPTYLLQYHMMTL